MTMRISRQKVTKILKYYFKGLTQPVIAQRVGVDQSTVALYASRFSERASAVGLLEAGKEFKVSEEVSELRCLSVELLKNNLTAEDARQGVKIINAFEKLGVDPDQYTGLIEVCKRIDDPGFINAALKLNRLETDGQLSYEEAMSKFERINLELPQVNKELEEAKANLRTMINLASKKDGDLKSLDAEIKQTQRKAETRRAMLEQEYEVRRKQLDIKQQEVEEVAALKAKLHRDNLDIATIVKLVKEYSQGTQQVNGILVRRAIEEHGSLDKATRALRNERALLEKKNFQLKKQNSDLELTRSRISIETKEGDKRLENQRLEFSQRFLAMMRDSRQYELFQGFLAMIGSSPSANGSVESLIASLQLIIQSGWYSSKTEKEWRSLFMQKVFGDYLQSFQCEHCGTRFMVNPRADKIRIRSSYECPACHYSTWVKPDDSFLKAMVSEEQLENTYRVEQLLEENNALKPFRVLLNLPCEICKQPIDEWNEENLEKGIIGVGWAHVKCWETASGKLTQFTRLARAALEIQEKKASNSGAETGS